MPQITLKAARVNAELSQKEVSDKLKVSLSTIVNWEKGHTDIPIGAARKLSELYGMPLENIFFGTESKKIGFEED